MSNHPMMPNITSMGAILGGILFSIFLYSVQYRLLMKNKSMQLLFKLQLQFLYDNYLGITGIYTHILSFDARIVSL
jgi:hypothetical protein